MTAADRSAAERLLAYLAETDSSMESAADLVIGFGVFDLGLPRFCADLFRAGHARGIVFTGGFGAGTGDLGGPEAEVWRAETRRTHPDIADAAYVIEARSTNTGENIRFTADLLKREHPHRAFGLGTHHVIIVTSPSRLRRTWLTVRQVVPTVRITRQLPHFAFATEHALYARQGVDYLAHLVGEIDRLTLYADRGWIVREAIPPEITAAAEQLRVSFDPFLVCRQTESSSRRPKPSA